MSDAQLASGSSDRNHLHGCEPRFLDSRETTKLAHGAFGGRPDTPSEHLVASGGSEELCWHSESPFQWPDIVWHPATMLKWDDSYQFHHEAVEYLWYCACEVLKRSLSQLSSCSPGGEHTGILTSPLYMMVDSPIARTVAQQILDKPPHIYLISPLKLC